jgi:hypothetical protein
MLLQIGLVGYVVVKSGEDKIRRNKINKDSIPLVIR